MGRQIKQDTETVHLLDDDGQPLCDVEHARGVAPSGIVASEWAAGFTSATLGSRVCRACEEKAGTAARFDPGEREQENAEAGLPKTDA